MVIVALNRSLEQPLKQEYSSYFTDVGIKNDKANGGSYFEETMTGLSQHCNIHVLCFNASNLRINILTKFHELLIKTAPSCGYTRFFHNLTK